MVFGTVMLNYIKIFNKYEYIKFRLILFFFFFFLLCLVGIFYVLHCGDGRGEPVGSGADRVDLHLPAGQTRRDLALPPLHGPARWVITINTLLLLTKKIQKKKI